jgi:hypothetical protein
MLLEQQLTLSEPKILWDKAWEKCGIYVQWAIERWVGTLAKERHKETVGVSSQVTVQFRSIRLSRVTEGT